MKFLRINKKISLFLWFVFVMALIWIFPTNTLAQDVIIQNDNEFEEYSFDKSYKLKIGYNYPEYGESKFEEGLSLWLTSNIHSNYELQYYGLDYEEGKNALINKEIDLLFTSSNTPLVIPEGIIESDITYFSEFYGLFEKNTSKELKNISSNVDLLKSKDVIVIKDDGEIIEVMAQAAVANVSIKMVENLEEAIEVYEKNKENSIVIVGSWRIFDLLSYGYDIERIFPEYRISKATVQATAENSDLIELINRKINADSEYFENLADEIKKQKKREIFQYENILSEDEMQWLEDNDEVTIKIIQYREPILFKDENENLQGLLVDILKEFSYLTNIRIKYQFVGCDSNKPTISFMDKLNDNEIYALNYNTSLVNEEDFESSIDINNKIGIVHKESDLNELINIYNDDSSAIGVIHGSPSQRYFDEIFMKNYKVYYDYNTLITDFNENKIKYFSTLEMNFFEIQLNYDEIAFFKELETIRSYPMFLFNKESILYDIFNKAIGFINWYELNDYWQDNMNSKINEKSNERFNKSLELTKLNTFVITLAGMILIVAVIITIFSAKNNEKNRQLKSALSKLEMAQSAKNLFFANMSHEIRTPIYTILGMNYFLKKSKSLDCKEKRYLDNIDVAANMLANLVNDILDYSKIEEKKINIENRNFRLKELEEDAIAIFSDRIKEKGLEFAIESNYDKDLIVESDKLRLSQVIVNLIGNAFKFTEKGSITLKIDETKQLDDSSIIKVSVIDTGIGIEERKLDIIWNDFEQIQNDLSENYNGTGLGLAICRRIIETLGGKVWVKSCVGKGSSFGFTILIKHGQVNSNKFNDSNKKTEDLAGKRMLVVEDNIINLEIALNILQEFGVKCDEATNGREAIEMCEDKSEDYYDLILMDINMPNMNGYDAVKVLRDGYNIKSPIAFMTATILDDNKEKEFEDYIDGIILKPINPDDIKEQILKLIKTEK